MSLSLPNLPNNWTDRATEEDQGRHDFRKMVANKISIVAKGKGICIGGEAASSAAGEVNEASKENAAVVSKTKKKNFWTKEDRRRGGKSVRRRQRLGEFYTKFREACLARDMLVQAACKVQTRVQGLHRPPNQAETAGIIGLAISHTRATQKVVHTLTKLLADFELTMQNFEEVLIQKDKTVKQKKMWQQKYFAVLRGDADTDITDDGTIDDDDDNSNNNDVDGNGKLSIGQEMQQIRHELSSVNESQDVAMT